MAEVALAAQDIRSEVPREAEVEPAGEGEPQAGKALVQAAGEKCILAQAGPDGEDSGHTMKVFGCSQRESQAVGSNAAQQGRALWALSGFLILLRAG